MKCGFAHSFRVYSQSLPGFLEIATLAGIEGSVQSSLGVKQLVITGGGGGLGSALIQVFTSPHWTIFAPDRKSLDVSNPDSFRHLPQLGSADLLVCAAGMIRDRPLLRMDEPAWDEVIATNYEGAAASANAVLPGMIARRRGHIVFISSSSAIHPPIGQVAYATAKAALLGLTASLAKKNGCHGVRVNAILPGFLETRMTRTVSQARKREILYDHVLGRFNQAETVAHFIRYLHDHLPDTSGQVFQLDSRPS